MKRIARVKVELTIVEEEQLDDEWTETTILDVQRANADVDGDAVEDAVLQALSTAQESVEL
ncbi:hypothetical protein [Rhodococcoides fascians]|uniref:hypothetical protein n=1 Tax=Rhodococcoides fascians TaxID=1828 RepID=UPI000560C658|nr:hypothetical protein [Rhodococcus fascians]